MAMDSRTPPFAETAIGSSPAGPVDRTIHYHNQTKHHFFRYARSLGHLDWANQPNPFRRFANAPFFPLPLLKPDQEPLSPPYEAIHRHGAVPPQPVTLVTLSRFLELALGITAWKQAGETRWALRSNPSSGNLHPTEGYLLLPPMQGFAGTHGLYHYAPHDHGLELRAELPKAETSRLLGMFPAGACLLAFTSIIWREAWKYGERAFRWGGTWRCSTGRTGQRWRPCSAWTATMILQAPSASTRIAWRSCGLPVMKPQSPSGSIQQRCRP
jgi:hypothetical protein